MTANHNSMSHLYLDDCRPAPAGWLLTKTAAEMIALLAKGGVTHLSLDHDLGDDPSVGNGYDVLLWLEQQVALYGFVPPQIRVHSANVGARPKMEAAILAIRKLAERW
jgi:hypothetical protein